jgi:sodium/bile acid cotransporter 7
MPGTKTIICIGLAAIALLAGIGLASNLARTSALTDAQKRGKVFNMYAEYKKSFPEVQDIDAQLAMELANTGKVIFIDVRPPEERSVSHLPGAISADDFLENPEKYGDYIKIGYCTISYRSGFFAQKMNQNGVPMYNLRAGLLAWVHSGGKVYDEAGETKRIHVYGQEWNLAPERYEAVW